MANIREIAASRTRGAHYRNREFADMVLAEPSATPVEIALAERLLGGTQPAHRAGRTLTLIQIAAHEQNARDFNSTPANPKE